VDFSKKKTTISGLGRWQILQASFGLWFGILDRKKARPHTIPLFRPGCSSSKRVIFISKV